MNKISKSAFQIILGGIFFLSVAVLSCNSDEEKKEATPEPTVTEKPMEPSQPVPDTSKGIDTTGKTKPVIPGS